MLESSQATTTKQSNKGKKMDIDTTITEPIDAPTAPVPRVRRTLDRNTDDKMIAGVCSGIGRYFDIHTSLVRVAFVVFTLLGGAGLLAYAVLWFAVDRGPGRDAALYNNERNVQ